MMYGKYRKASTKIPSILRTRRVLASFSIAMALVLLLVGHASAGVWSIDQNWEVLRIYLDPGQKTPDKDRITGVPIYTDAFVDASGAVRLTLDVFVDNDCEQLDLEIYQTHNLVATTPSFSSYSVIPHETTTVALDLVIPPNDTSGIEYFVGGCGYRVYARTYFVTKGDTIVFFEASSPSDFDLSIRKEEKRIQDSLYRLRTPILESQRTRENRRQGLGPTSGVGYYDDDGTFYHLDSLPPGFVKPQPPSTRQEPEVKADSALQRHKALHAATLRDTTLTVASPGDGTKILIKKADLADSMRVWKDRRRLNEMLEVLRQNGIKWQLDSLQQ